MSSLSLKISIVERNVVKTLKFEPALQAFDVCRIIREKILEANNLGQPKEYGLFLADEDPKKGVWLEPSRSLEYYLLRDGDLLEYRKKSRTLRVRMLDGTLKTMMVDDSQQIANLMVVICTKIGITNHDEYSLVRDLPEDEQQLLNQSGGTGTLTLRKKDKDKDQKMEQLKKKLKTDDEINWIDHSKTLREQGVDEAETLLLRRKFFFSDQNIDSRDPVQLNLLYVQTRDAIIDGTHPVTVEKACEFAGLQCQIQFGDHIETKHKPGFLDLKEFLPKDFYKTKGIEKRVFTEHRKFVGLLEIDAKVKYCQLARSLKTYGVTFFLVKEKMKGKNKLVPRLLGVTKDSVLRLDEKTKEILKQWPLTTVRRWAASPNTFTLDFGDYSDSYYSVQTTEGEQISQLIAGYIDIILKKKKAKDHFGIEGDEGSTMVEDSVSPAKATILQHQTNKVSHAATGSVALPAVMRIGDAAVQPYSTGQLAEPQFQSVIGQAHSGHIRTLPPQQPKVSTVLSEPQKALVSKIGTGQQAIRYAISELDAKPQIPELGTDPASMAWRQQTVDVSKQNVASQMAAMNAATAQVVTITGYGDEADHTALGAAITTITSSLPEMTRDVRMIAALMDSEPGGSDKLLDAARQLCKAFSDLLTAAEPESKEPRQSLLSAAGKVGETSTAMLQMISDEDAINNKEAMDILLGLAKAVANTTASLVLKAKAVAAKCEDQPTQNKVIASATQVALATSQLVACAKVVAPTIQSPACQQQLIEAAKEVARAVEGLVGVCQTASKDQNLLRDLSAAATEVTRALNDLLNHIRIGIRPRDSVVEGPVDTILSASDRLFSSTGNANEMVRQARILAQATAELIQSIKGEAEKQPDSDLQRRLLDAARALADATSRMVEAAKQCASLPHESKHQDELRMAAVDLRNVANVAASNALRRKIISQLQVSAKQAAAASSQAIAAAQGVAPYNKDPASQEELFTSCKEVQLAIPKVVRSVKQVGQTPDSASAQLALITASQDLLPPASQLVSSCRAAQPTIADQSSALQLGTQSQLLASALSDLKSNLTRAQQTCQPGALEIDSAIDSVKMLEEELDAFDAAVAAFNLKPLPGETAESASQKLAATSKTVGSSVAQLLTSVSQRNEEYTGIAARDTVDALADLTHAARGVAATTPDQASQRKIISSVRDVLTCSSALLTEARLNINNLSVDPSYQQRLTIVAKSVSHALNNLSNNLPGQREVEDALRVVTDATEPLSASHFPTSSKSYSELQNDLTTAAAQLNTATTDMVSASRPNVVHLGPPTKRFGYAFGNLINSGVGIASHTKDPETRSQMVVSMRHVSTVSSKLLVSAKSVVADPSSANAKTQLAAAARAVTEAINNLINVCTSSSPGQKECDNAIRNIQAMRPLLDNPSEPINDSSYYECLDNVMEKSKNLGDGMTGIANHAKQSEHDPFAHAVTGVSDSVCGLVEAAAQAAYLIAVSDPTSVAGRVGLVDQGQLAQAVHTIQSACNTLSSPSCNQQQVLSAATTIAKHTSSICNACRNASARTTNPAAKRHFVQTAKDVANATATLVKEIKVLDQDYSHKNRLACASATRPLVEALDNLDAYASSPEFASVPSKISPAARAAQEPITSAGRDIIDGSCSMIQTAKMLIVNPRDPPTWQSLASHSKAVSDAIKRLVTFIREKAPGQRECEWAVQRLSACIKELDQAALSAISQSLPPPRDGASLQQYNDQMISAIQQIKDKIGPVRASAKSEAEHLGHSVSQLVRYFDPLIESVVGSASRTLNSRQQMTVLDQAKTVTECALQLIYASKESGGNPKATHVHSDIDDSADALDEAVNELLHNLEQSSAASGIVTGLIDSINRSMLLIDDHRHSVVPGAESFVDYQTRMVQSCKEIARLAQDMVAKASTNVGELGGCAAALSHNYGKLADDSRGAISATTNVEIGSRIRSSVQELGNSCIDLAKASGACQASSGDLFDQRDIAEHARFVSERVSYVLAALQAGSRGTQACINAASTVSGIIGDLDTTVMFATAGTLHAENEDETFANHRENILKTAKALVEDTKTLVAGAASSQEQLAVAAQNAVATILQLSEVVKLGAASIGSNNSESQVMLLNSVKDVAAALGDLIHATKSASGKSIHDPSMLYLKESAKVMVTNVTSLLKTVKAVEDEHTRGTRALEATIEAIAQEIRAFNLPDPPQRRATAEELMRCTKPITLATAKAVSAGNSGRQDDVIVAANMGRKAIFDLLVTCKAAAWSSESHDVKHRTLIAGHDTATHYRELLQLVHQSLSRQTTEGKQRMTEVSRRIAQCVTEIVSACEALKGSDWVDPDDPTVIAENELLGAAAAIDAAAKKLAHLRPRRSVQETDVDLNFDEMILEACKAIAAATSALVKAASAAQRELVQTGKVSGRPLYTSDDGQWSEGLISAARMVAAATHSLCEAANSLVQGHATEEKLISAAKQVASSTAQLLVACKVKAESDSQAMRRLQAAGNAVKRATDNLVRAAQQAIEQEEERNIVINKRMVTGIAQEINAREEVLRIERELEEARVRLAAIRRAKYNHEENQEGMTVEESEEIRQQVVVQDPVYALNINNGASTNGNYFSSMQQQYSHAAQQQQQQFSQSREYHRQEVSSTYQTYHQSHHFQQK